MMDCLRKSVLLVTFFSLCFGVFAQLTNKSTYGLKNPYTNDADCKSCQRLLNNMPADVQFGLQLEENQIYFVMSDIQWFYRLFSASGDGLAVDVMARELYPCGKKNIETDSDIHKGYLLQPLLLKKMMKVAYTDDRNNVVVPLGYLPEQFWDQEVELNMILIQSKKVCLYQGFYDIPNRKFRLLEMGAFLDENFESGDQALSFSSQKSLKFTVPFKKNKATFSREDIAPLYDSLRLTNYTITDIHIQAYASVEGSKEANEKLQQQRAESMVEALQTFQTETVKTEIYTAENWVEFYSDIANTSYKKWASLSEASVKQQLANPDQLAELEPILAKHRKAVVTLRLELKQSFLVDDNSETIQKFNAAIERKDYEEARLIQKAVYSAIKEGRVDKEILKKLSLQKAPHVPLLNDRVVFEFDLFREIPEAQERFEEVLALDSTNAQINYNYCVFQIKRWAVKELEVKPSELEMSIFRLRDYGITGEVINRLLVNFYILKAGNKLRERAYGEKERALISLRSTYEKINLSNQDRLDLAVYLAGFAKYDWAIALLKDEVVKVDVDENLLFYYINLTITDDRLTRSTAYRNTLINASTIDKERFCKLFDTFGKGGITFQLLDNSYLKKSYCEFCE